MIDSRIQTAAFLDLDSIGSEDLDMSELEATADRWLRYGQANADQLDTALDQADLVVSNKVVLNQRHLSTAKRLKLVCIAATGTNNVDVAAAAASDIAVCNVAGYATASVVQHMFGLLLALTTHLNDYTAAVKRGDWSHSRFFCLLDFPVRELAGKTLGIVGFGHLGQAVAKLAEALGMKVLLARRNERDHRPGRIALAELLPMVDVLSLHCPLTEETRHLIGDAELALMKKDAVLINTARGGLVDESALLVALRNQRIGGAGLDVLQQEPPPADHPLLTAELNNLIITPHTAWISRESRQRLVDEIVLNIEAYKSGQVRNRVV